MNAVEVVPELLGMMHMLTSFADILHAQCMRVLQWLQQMLAHNIPVARGSIQCRYDKLVGMFSSKDVPAVGVSIGIERVFNLLEDKVMAGCKDESGVVCGKIRETDTEVTDLCLAHAACCMPVGGV